VALTIALGVLSMHCINTVAQRMAAVRAQLAGGPTVE
jgi:CDP-diacylglycerol--glycerol-3-phosphate 3-phosphatidyltransferase